MSQRAPNEPEEPSPMNQNSKFRVFITGSGIAPEAQQLLRVENCVFETGTPKDSSDEIAAKLKIFNPDALIVRQGKITESVLNAASNLKAVCKHGVGTDNIDIEAATRTNIPIFYTPNANFEAVATHTFALMMSLIRNIPSQDNRIRNGIFDKAGYSGQELQGKTLGLIGFGKVGRRLSEMVAPFQMKVLAYHPSTSNETLASHITETHNINEVISQADILSLHCPLVPETKHIIDKHSFAKMKKGAYLINTARGGIINETDLLTALKEELIGGAALDVFEIEPPSEDNPLLQQNNIILTTHIAGSSDNSLKNMGIEAVQHVLSVLKGEPADTSSMKNKEVLFD